MGGRQSDEHRTTNATAASTFAELIQSSAANHVPRLLTLAALFLGYLTCLILSPAMYWGLRRLLPEDQLYWTLGGIGYLSRNLSLAAVALLCAWGVLGRGSLLRRVLVVALGGTWIWMAYYAGLMIINRVRSDTAVALGTFGICISLCSALLRLRGWQISTPLDEAVRANVAWQFQLRDVILGMAVFGVTLGTFLRLPGDILGIFREITSYYMYLSFWENCFWHYLIPLPIVLVCLPAPRLGRRWVALAVGLTLLAVLIEPILYFLVIDPTHSPIKNDRYPQGLRIFAIQRIELSLLCLGTAAILQRIGFRLESTGKIPPTAANHSQG